MTTYARLRAKLGRRPTVEEQRATTKALSEAASSMHLRCPACGPRILTGQWDYLWRNGR